MKNTKMAKLKFTAQEQTLVWSITKFSMEQ